MASTSHGKPVAPVVPVAAVPRRFGQLPSVVVPDDFDAALSEAELEAWEGSQGFG